MTENTPDAVVQFVNGLMGAALHTMAHDDYDLAAMWMARMQEAGGWWISPPVEGGWSDVLVDGDRFARVASHPDPDTWMVELTQRGMKRRLMIRATPVPGDGGEVE